LPTAWHIIPQYLTHHAPRIATTVND
jgi:hypothetical protein